MHPSRQQLQDIESDVRELLRICALGENPCLVVLDLEWIWPVLTYRSTYKDGRPLPDGHPHGGEKTSSTETHGWPHSVCDALYVIRTELKDRWGRSHLHQPGEVLTQGGKVPRPIPRRRLERLRLAADTIRDVLREKIADSDTLPVPTRDSNEYTALRVLFEQEAFNASKCLRTEDIARFGIGPDAKANIFKRRIADLQHSGWVNTSEGRCGGVWLTERGKSQARKLFSQQVEAEVGPGANRGLARGEA